MEVGGAGCFHKVDEGTQRMRLYFKALWCPLNLELHKDIINTRQLLKKGRLGLTIATMWTNLEDVVLNEIRQLQKDTYYESTYTRYGEQSDRQRQKEERWVLGAQGGGVRANFV